MQQEVPQLRFAATRLASGPKLHYAEQGDRGGEPIVFLPAYTDSWFSFSRVLPLLPPRYHAYAVDQRGHGDSERPACYRSGLLPQQKQSPGPLRCQNTSGTDR